jgi:hypothetical protein
MVNPKTFLSRITGLALAGVFAVVFMPQVLFAVTGDAVVTNSGQSVPDATIVIETPEGKPVAQSKTDSKGQAALNLPEGQTNKPTVVKVTEPNGKTTAQTVEPQPGPDPWSRISLDFAGGIATYTYPQIMMLKREAEPIIIGTNSEVGSGARVKQKLAETAGGVLGGFLGGLGGRGMSVGGRGDDLDSDSEPELAEDPVPKTAKRIFTDPATGTKIAVGGVMTPDGLVISTTILNSPDKGTFQTVYLMDDAGRRAGPTLYDIYELWGEWTLTVSWTYDKYVNGRHVEHREGGWSDTGIDFIGTFVVPHKNNGIWKQLGFSNAKAGVKSLGTTFPVNPQMLRSKRLHLVIQISRPSLDPVTTVPFVLTMPPVPDGTVQLLKAM